MSVTVTDDVFRFGGFTLDLRKGTIAQNDEPVFLRPKAFALLTHLARNMGRIVPKAELMEVAWPGVYVTEDSLTQSIREIRKVLGDDLVRHASYLGENVTLDNPLFQEGLAQSGPLQPSEFLAHTLQRVKAQALVLSFENAFRTTALAMALAIVLLPGFKAPRARR